MYPDHMIQTWGPDPECEEWGESGLCGKTCPVFQRGECEVEEDIVLKDDKNYAEEIANTILE